MSVLKDLIYRIWNDRQQDCFTDACTRIAANANGSGKMISGRVYVPVRLIDVSKIFVGWSIVLIRRDGLLVIAYSFILPVLAF